MKEYLKKSKNINSKEYFESYYPNRCFICKKKIDRISNLEILSYLSFIYPCCKRKECLSNKKTVYRKKIERFLFSEMKYDLKKDIGYLRTIPKEKRGYRITSLLKKKYKEESPPNWWINRETHKVCKYLNKLEDL